MSSPCRACPLFLLHVHWVHGTLFSEPTWFSTATCGLCSVTSKTWCVDNGVSLRVEGLSVRRPEKDTRHREKCTFQDFLRHAPSLFYLCFPRNQDAVTSYLSVSAPQPPSWTRSVCQISHQWLRFSTSNSMEHLPRVAVLLCRIVFVMKCFYIVERSRRLQLKPLWLLSNKQLCKWRKKPRHFVNKNSLSYSIWLILTIFLPHTGSHMI